MDIQPIIKIVAPIVTAILVFIIKRILEHKPKLITYLVHVSAIPLKDEKSTIVNTHSIVVRNAGKKTANNVRIGHDHLPASYQMYPQMTHEVKYSEHGPAEIVLPTLVPNEQVNISYLYFPPTTYEHINSYCKSDEMQAKSINIIPAPHLGRLFVFCVWALMFVGASTIVYLIMFGLWWYIK